MNLQEKIKKSWWIILSFIPFIDGFGFIYVGFRHNNKNWILEGIIYELPWFLYFLFFGGYGNPDSFTNPSGKILSLAMLLMVISIIRSIWVAIKLFNIDSDDKTTFPKTEDNNILTDKTACCVCLFFIFLIFALIAIL